jgi:hypothetical protein
LTGQIPGEWVSLINGKNFTDARIRYPKLEHGQAVTAVRSIYAPVVRIACTRRRVGPPDETAVFEAVVDTGFTGQVAISSWHYEQFCQGPGFSDLPPATRAYAADGREIEGSRAWSARVWFFPDGSSPVIAQPIRPVLFDGIMDIRVLSPGATLAFVGMEALYSLHARVELDFTTGSFSILVPKQQ